MKTTIYSYIMRTLAFAVLICISPVQILKVQAQEPDAAAVRKATILNVMRNLEEKHVRPKPIDDNFSKIIWKKYIESLDPNKEIWLKSDFEQLKKYELSIDNELRDGSSDFFTAAFQLYQQRLTAVAAGYQKILARPLQFTKNESVQLNPTLRDFAKNQEELTTFWQQRAKHLVLKKMMVLDKSKINSPDLEKEARAKIDKWMANTFRNLSGALALNKKFSHFLNTVTLEVDPHTNYFEPIEIKNINEQMGKRFSGLGMEIQEIEGDLYIKAMRQGGAALKSGLLDIDDRIVSLSDATGKMIDVTGFPATDIANLIRGEKDTEVSLGLVKANGQEKTVAIKRAEINDQEGRARSAIIEKDGHKIGYLYLLEFYVDMVDPVNGIKSSEDVKNEILKLKMANVKGIIFDLRNNGGGSLTDVVKIAGYFTGPGPKVQIKNPGELKIHTTDEPALYTGPLLVLVNEGSASASEIFSATMQDYNRGIIVGSPSTFGKGTAQGTIPMGKMGDRTKGIPNLSYGSLRLTQHQFYRVNGGSTQLRGVQSDVVLPGKLGHIKTREKDKITAFAWDSISPATYTPSKDAASWKKTVQMARAVVGQNNIFNHIDENSKLLAEQQLIPSGLSIAGFMKQQETLLSCTQQIDQLEKLPALKKLKVSAAPGYSEAPENDWYNKWTEKLSSDVYLDKSLDIINKIMFVK